MVGRSGLWFKRHTVAGLRRLALASALVLGGGVPSASAAMTQIAEFTNNGVSDSAGGFRWMNFDNSSATFDTANGGAPITFTYTNLPNVPTDLQGPQAAHIQFDTGTDLDGTTVNGQVSQPLTVPIHILILRDTPAAEGANNQHNLLTITITPNASMSIVSGQNGSGSLNASTPGQTITYSSDFFDFSRISGAAFGLTLSGIIPGLSFDTDNGRNILNSFTAAALGSVSADLNPVPEPGSLALMGIGCVVVAGAGFKRYRRTK
jgi:hypothetical protein